MSAISTATAWEYRMARIELPGFDDDPTRNLESLNRFGSDGWEVIGVLPSNDGNKFELPGVDLLMKRPKS